MSGLTLQKIKPIIDVAAVVRKRLDEEAASTPLAYGSLKVHALAEILGGQARRPQWIGKGWKDNLGSGEDALDPAGVARALGADARKGVKVVAWGAIIDVPKGLSLLCASDPELKSWFSGIREKLVETYLDQLEKGCVVRVGDGGYKKVPVSGLKGWWVGHAASAGGDPHMHIHLVISATAETIDSRRGQIDGRKLLNETAKLADGAARRVLALEMAKIGLGFGLDGEVVGVDPEIIERASTGRSSVKAIQTYFASQGTPVSDEQAWHHWRQICEGKADKGLPVTLVKSIKVARGEELGGEAIEHAMDEAMADPEKSKVVGAWLAQKYGVSDWDGMSKVAKEAWAEYPKYDDVTSVIALMATLPRAPKPEAVAGLCARFADDDARPALMNAVAADPRVLVGDMHWVLRSQLDREEKVRDRVTKLLSGGNPDVSDVTTATIDQLLANTDGAPLSVITGVAGGGKSSTLAIANQHWSTCGVTVWATARNRLTATETGISAGASQARTLSTSALRRRITLGGPNIPKPGDVLVVDELGLLDHGDIEMILALAESGVMVKALGDAHQIQPIDGSTSARLVMDLARKCGMPTLDETKRCEPWKEVHDPLRDVVTGDSCPEEVLGLLDIRSADNIEEVIAILNELPAAEIVVQSNDLRCQVAEALPRPEMKMLPGSDKPNIAMLRDSIAGWVGDQVVLRRNLNLVSPDGELSGSLHNGQKGEIVKVNSTSVVIKVGQHLTSIKRDVAKDILALGGVHTGDSAQGQTWDRAVVIVTGIETREWLYSAATRGRNAPVIVALSGSDVSNSDDAISLVEQVLLREGMAQTVDEMCKTDATLAQSVHQIRGGNSSDTGGFADLGDEATEAEPVELEPTEPEVSHEGEITEPDIQEKPKITNVSSKIFGTWDDEPVGPVPPLEEIKEALRRDREASGYRNYHGGFFYKNDDDIWVVDGEKRYELHRKMASENPMSPALGTYFNITKARKIERGSDEMYYPDLDTEWMDRVAKYEAKRDADTRASQAIRDSSYDTSRGRGSGGGTSQGHSGGYGYGKR